MMARALAHSSALRCRLAWHPPGPGHDASVDPALILLALAHGPLRLDARAAWYGDPFGALVVPVATVPDRGVRILAELRLPLGERVANALAWGATEPALRAAASSTAPLSADAALDTALRRWAQGEAARLGLAPGEASVATIADDGKPRPATAEERAALGDVQDILATLAWPRWRGPLVLVPYGVAHPAIAPGQARVVRAALPVLRPPEGGRAGLAVAIGSLAMALSAPPASGWPAWLERGVAGCVRARALGTGIPERTMAERRAHAGAPAIAAMLSGAVLPEDELATAVVACLLHPSRRQRWPDLLELLRHCPPDGAAGAVTLAYGLSLERLAAEPGAGAPRR